MLPSLRQRSLMLAAMVVGGWVFGFAAGRVLEASPIETMVLLSSSRPVTAALWFIGATLVAGLLGAVCGTTGHRFAGPFVLSVAMIGAAVAGKPIDSFLIAAIEPTAHLQLAVEAVVLAAILLAAFIGMTAARAALRKRFAVGSDVQVEPLLTGPTKAAPWPRAAATVGLALVIASVVLAFLLGVDAAKAFALSVLVGLPGLAVIHLAVAALGRLRFIERPDTVGGAGVSPWSQFASGVLMMILGGAIAVLLLRQVETGQMVGGLLLSFGVAAWGTDRMLPGGARWMLLLSPLGLAIGAYGWVAWGLPDGATLWEAFGPSRGRMSNLGAIPPVFYASAGVAGAAVGLGLIDTVRAHEAAARPDSAPVSDSATDVKAPVAN